MKITNLEIRKLEIPFNISFKHASAEREVTESILVVAESGNNHKGYGEGCPRSYVTGEQIDLSMAFFDKHKSSIQTIENLNELKVWTEEQKKDIDANPAAWCAIELALLDLLGKEQGKSIEELMSLPKLKDKFHYTAVLGVSNYEVFKKQLQQYVHSGFNDFKLKISGKLEEDIEKLNLINKLGDKGSRIRLDANNLWYTPSEAIAYLKQLNANFFAIEEPVTVDQYDALSTIAETLCIKIILDESFLRKEQFEYIQDNPEPWIINLRVSKMGGILRSLDIAEEANRLNVPIIVGAQVGETSILTRSAITVANTYGNILLAQEGAFGIHLLQKDIVRTPLMFGKGGMLSTSSLIGKQGLGLFCTI